MYNVEFIVKDLIDNIPDLKEDILKNLLKQYSIEKIFTASIDANKIREGVAEIEYKMNNISKITLDKYLSFMRKEEIC
jgi:hypothetical protein